jgi:hypothetical protein
LSIETTTGMSAPPIAITMWTPKEQRDARHDQKRVSPPLRPIDREDLGRDRQPRAGQVQTVARRQVSGLPPMLTVSLPNAMTNRTA